MSKWEHFRHVLGLHRWVGEWQPPCKRKHGEWVWRFVCKECGAVEVRYTWGGLDAAEKEGGK